MQDLSDDLSHLATRTAFVRVVDMAQHDAARVDAAWLERATASLAELALQRDEPSKPLQRAALEVLAHLGGPTAPGHAAAHSVLLALLRAAVGAGGPLAEQVCNATGPYIERLSPGYEATVASLVCGARSVEACCAAVQPALAALGRVLATTAETKQRQRAIGCLAEVWTCARARWPEATTQGPRATDTQAAPSGGGAHLGALLMGCAAPTALTDPQAAPRLAATRFLGTLAPVLARDEVLRLALLKLRDRDKEVRRAGLKVLVAVGGKRKPKPREASARGEKKWAEEMASEEEQARLPFAQAIEAEAEEPGLGSRLSAEQLHLLVLHGASSPDAPAAQRELVEDAFWDWMVVRQEEPVAALRELGVINHLKVYEPILRRHAESLFLAAFELGEAEAAKEEGEYDDDELSEELGDAFGGVGFGEELGEEEEQLQAQADPMTP